MQHLLKAFGDKVPKVVVAAIDIVLQIVSSFGVRVRSGCWLGSAGKRREGKEHVDEEGGKISKERLIL